MAKTKMRNKAYRPKPVHRIPPILLGIEASTDRLNKLTAVARNALLKLHYEAAEEGDYLILTRTVFVGHRLTKNFEDQDALRAVETHGLTLIIELEERSRRGEPLQRSKLTEVEEAVNLALDEMSKARLFDVIEADAYFDAYRTDIMTKLREIVRREMEAVSQANNNGISIPK